MGTLRNKRSTGGLYDLDFQVINRAYKSLLATTVLVGFVDLIFFSLAGMQIFVEATCGLLADFFFLASVVLVIFSKEVGKGHFLTQAVVLVWW